MAEIPITLREGGGDLMTRTSADEAGAFNYVLKRDWRREKNDEVRREGDRLFAPKAGEVGLQPYPNDPDVDEAVTLHFTARRDDGETAYICATPTRIFRYYAFEDAKILVDDVYEAGVYAAIGNGVWLVIGENFTTENAHRWEAVNAGGYAVFNNGIDLPVTYQLSDFAVKPIYELREQGVAFVGTIEEIEGVLLLGDIAQIHSDYLKTVMLNVGYAGFANGQEEHIDRVHYRIVWGDPGSPLRWGAAVPGAMTQGSRLLTVEYPILSIQPGDKIRVIGAGAAGADLLTTLLYKSTELAWIVADKAALPVSGELVSKQDASALLVGRYDTLDVSSPILRIKKFSDRIVVAKSTGFVLGEFTGEGALPFVFQSIYAKDKDDELDCLVWRWTLVDVGGEYLLYASETDFYRFDLITRRPKLHFKLSLCSDVFFSQMSAADPEAVFATQNGFTKEVWFIFPSATADKALAYDISADRCSTLGEAYASAAMIERPSATIARGSAEKWFVMGLANGTVVQYGFDRTGPLLWTRRGNAFNSDLHPGYADFGDAGNEKHLSYYLLLLASQSPDTQVTVGFWGVRNPSEPPEEQPGSPEVFDSPAARNIAYLHYLLHLVQERIRATGASNVRITKRVWAVGQVGGSSFVRR